MNRKEINSVIEVIGLLSYFFLYDFLVYLYIFKFDVVCLYMIIFMVDCLVLVKGLLYYEIDISMCYKNVKYICNSNFDGSF